MSERSAIEERLAAHVESILRGAAFRKRDRDYLAEELYGHLWERWRDAVATGMDEQAAADQALGSFGEPARIARDVTLAYHSRLYASTIGVLVPTVWTSNAKPRAYYAVWAVLFATFWEVTAVLVRATMAWTPVRAGIGFAGGLIAYAAVFIVLMAYNARQRWALGFAAFELPFLFWWAGVQLWAGVPIEVLLASLVGLVAGTTIMVVASTPARGQGSADRSAFRGIARAAASRDLGLRSLAGWLYRRPVPRGLLVGLAVMLIAGSAMQAVALGVSDPTQVAAGDMDVRVSVSCDRTGSGDLGTVVITGSFVFQRTDVWPNGMMQALGGGGPTDYVALAVEGSRPNGIPMVTPQLTQAPAGRDTTDGSPLALGLGGQDGRSMFAIADSTRLKAGHRYEVMWNYSVEPGLRDVTPVVFGYDHLDRFVLQATATCGQTGIGRVVAQLYVTGP
jgi:hypothetical protein